MHGNLPNPVQTTGKTTHHFGMAGYPTVCVTIAGTISAGNFQAQAYGAGDSPAPVNIPAIAPDGSIVSTIGAAGTYRFDVNGYNAFELVPSNDFSGNAVVVSSVASPSPMFTQTISEADMALIASDWVAGTYAANSVVIYSGAIWSNNVSTSGTPGVSGWNQYTNLAALITYILTQ